MTARSPEDICDQAVNEHDELVANLPDAFVQALDRSCPDWYVQSQIAYIAIREPQIAGDIQAAKDDMRIAAMETRSAA